MCGRYTQTATPDVIAEHFHLDEPPLLKPRYNIAPSQQVAAIRINPDAAKRDQQKVEDAIPPSLASLHDRLGRVAGGQGRIRSHAHKEVGMMIRLVQWTLSVGLLGVLLILGVPQIGRAHV